jgi:hypothetical protein
MLETLANAATSWIVNLPGTGTERVDIAKF